MGRLRLCGRGRFLLKKGGDRLERSKRALIWRFLRPHLWIFALTLVFSMGNTVLGSLTPQVVRVAVDSILGGEPFPKVVTALVPEWLLAAGPMTQLLAAAGFLLAVAVLAGLCTYGSRMGTAKGSENFVKSLRDALYRHIQRLPYAWHVRNSTGEIIQRCTSDVEVVRNFVTNQLLEVFRIVFLVGFSLAVMLSMNGRMTLIAAGFLPVVLLYSAFFYSRIARRFLTADEAEGELSAAVQENLTGVRVVRAFGREAFEVERFDQKNERFASLWIRLGRLLSAYWGVGDLITGLQILTVISVGVLQTVDGEITLGEFLAFVSYNQSLVWPVRGLGRILSEMSKAGVSIERLAYILDSEPEQEPENAQTPPMDRDIVFDRVCFAYGGQPVLHDVSFTIPAGSTFAVLGATGSGKSTMMHLLDRLYDLPPDSGRITVGGVDILNISRPWLRRNIGIVLQEPFLFSRTIRENIAAVRPAASMEEVRRQAQTAHIDEAILEFGDGYDTIVGERGVTLSGGQKQRVAIARALMQDAPILIFDDSLSAVDAETDAEIRASLHRAKGSATVILVSHRITTLMQADRILVLKDGRVAELGSHEELMERRGLYREIYDLQMTGEDRDLLFAEEGGESHGL